jgi:2-(1,2-epoxy-1,2-dihydrophenyl)acetyl-CoA isomerase
VAERADGPAVRSERRGAVAHLTLDRPHSGNALDVELARALERAVTAAAVDDAVRVILLSASGPHFCVGGDLAAMRAAPDRRAHVRELVDAAHGAVRALEALTKPIVTAVQGPAAGAGLSLVLLSDLVLASPRATFTTAYTAVGLTPDCGQSWLLPRAVGLGRALELTLLPRRMSVEEAHRLGIVTRVVVSAELADETELLLEQLTSGPARAAGAARALLRAGSTAGLLEHLDREAATITELAGTDEAGARIEAFLAPRRRRAVDA